MSDSFGMRDSDFISHDRPSYASALPRREYYQPLPRANMILVRDHLQNALHAQPNAEAQKYIVLAIKELERI